MSPTVSQAIRYSLVIVSAATLFTACTDGAPLQPEPAAAPARFATAGPVTESHPTIAQIRRATNRYHELDVAIKDGFVLLHDCEVRPGEGPVGIVYVHLGRLTDGRFDPLKPDALIYEPVPNRLPKLVGVEFAVPYSQWKGTELPRYLGAVFQREDEFQVFGLHAWVWRANPNGLFAETNPNVSCGPTT